jgi:hypothetical protein
VAGWRGIAILFRFVFERRVAAYRGPRPGDQRRPCIF